MANTRLFDSWQIGMDLPAPFDRAIDGACGIQRRKRTVPATTRRQEGKKQHSFPSCSVRC